MSDPRPVSNRDWITKVSPQMSRYLPCLVWGRAYTRSAFTKDAAAAVIVTIMLIPQSLAYALLAGLPAEMGLYASILPLIAYAIFGTSRALSVGPVAIVSLMTAAAISNLGLTETFQIISAAITLAFLSGLILLAMGVFRLGFLVNFLSHPVISGFITASGIIIAISQLKHILGVSASGHNLYELILSLSSKIGQANIVTLGIGLTTVLFLFWVRQNLKPLLIARGWRSGIADIVAKAGPVGAIVATTLAV
jgi:SulP family sulfate permease